MNCPRPSSFDHGENMSVVRPPEMLKKNQEMPFVLVTPQELEAGIERDAKDAVNLGSASSMESGVSLGLRVCRELLQDEVKILQPTLGSDTLHGEGFDLPKKTFASQGSRGPGADEGPTKLPLKRIRLMPRQSRLFRHNVHENRHATTRRIVPNYNTSLESPRSVAPQCRNTFDYEESDFPF